MEKTFSVRGMTCESCENKVEQSLQEIEGVVSAVASRSHSRVQIELNKPVNDSVLMDAASVDGKYEVSPYKESEANADQHEHHKHAEESSQEEESLYPLFLIVGYIFATCVLIAISQGEFILANFARHFMAGFFLVFSFFKLLDLSGFVDAYRGYDILARRSEAWAKAYPFVELSLGVAYAINLLPFATNVLTFFLMIIGAVGVLKALLDKKSIRCACLGTALNLPMTKVTLVEDLTMAAMAAAMLLYFV